MSTSSSSPSFTTTIGGVAVPPMAIGTWAWGDTSIWGYKEEDNEKIKEAWDACNGVGLTFYDTAEIYGEGKSESIIGELIKGTDAETRRKLYIATKFLPFPRPANFFFFTPGVVAACQKSLKRLGVDKIDLYQIHSPTGPHSIESTCNELAKCVQMGMVKSVGVSNFGKAELIRAYDTLAKHNIPLASNQLEFSLLRQLPDRSGLLAEMQKRNIACLGYSPLAMGRLTGKYSASNPVPKGRRFSSEFTWEQLEPLLDAMRKVADKHGVSVSAVALNWVICKGVIPLGGAKNRQQAEQNARAATFRLTDEEVTMLGELGFPGKTDRFWQHG